MKLSKSTVLIAVLSVLFLAACVVIGLLTHSPGPTKKNAKNDDSSPSPKSAPSPQAKAFSLEIPKPSQDKPFPQVICKDTMSLQTTGGSILHCFWFPSPGKDPYIMDMEIGPAETVNWLQYTDFGVSGVVRFTKNDGAISSRELNARWYTKEVKWLFDNGRLLWRTYRQNPGQEPLLIKEYFAEGRGTMSHWQKQGIPPTPLSPAQPTTPAQPSGPVVINKPRFPPGKSAVLSL